MNFRLSEFELTYPVVQNICDKKGFRGHNVLRASLVLLRFDISEQNLSVIIYTAVTNICPSEQTMEKKAIVLSNFAILDFSCGFCIQ